MKEQMNTQTAVFQNIISEIEKSQMATIDFTLQATVDEDGWYTIDAVNGDAVIFTIEFDEVDWFVTHEEELETYELDAIWEIKAKRHAIIKKVKEAATKVNFNELIKEKKVSIYSKKYFQFISDVTFEEAIKIGNTEKGTTLKCRSIDDKTERRKYKSSNFYTFTPHASFHGQRKYTDKTVSTNIIGIDIDKKGNEEFTPKDVYNLLKEDKYVGLIQESCSGWIVAYVAYNGNLQGAYTELEEYFKNTYNLVIDPTCKDYTRCRFICYSELPIIIKEAEIWQVKNNAYGIENVTLDKVSRKQNKAVVEPLNAEMDEVFKDDYYQLDLVEFIKKYKSLKLNENNSHDFQFTEYGYANVDGEYIEIQRRICKGEDGKIHIRKLYDGEQRRHYLTKIASTYKAIYGDKITLESLVYSLQWEVLHFIDNSKDVISKAELVKIALWALNRAIEPQISKKKYIVSKDMKKQSRSVVGKAKAQSHYQVIDELIDVNLTFDENLQLLADKGHKVSNHCLSDYYADRGLLKLTKREIKKNAVRALYEVGDTAKQLKEKCDDNDIKITLPSIYTYIREFEEEIIESIDVEEVIENVIATSTEEEVTETIVEAIERIITFISLKDNIDIDEAFEKFRQHYIKLHGIDICNLPRADGELIKETAVYKNNQYKIETR